MRFLSPGRLRSLDQRIRIFSEADQGAGAYVG
jgi:hypothetical protein